MAPDDTLPPDTQPAHDTITPPRPRYGKGWTPDAKDRTHGPVHLLIGGPPEKLAPPPNACGVQLRQAQAVIGVHNQGQTSACVGFTLAEVIAARCYVLGTPIEEPSAQGFYTFGRAEERKDPANTVALTAPLEDTGCQPGLAIAGACEYGIPSAKDWPFDPATINDLPDEAKLQAASSFVLNGWYAINETGAARVLAVRHTLAKEIPVMLATGVDMPFEDYDGTGAITKPDPTKPPPDFEGPGLPGHMVSVVYAEPNPDRPGEFRFLLWNHWDVTWGLNGLAWVDESFIIAAFALFAISVTPAAP